MPRKSQKAKLILDEKQKEQLSKISQSRKAPIKEVKNEVIKTIELAANNGGYIMSSSNSIHPACKPENYISMINTVHKYGIY